MADKQKLYDYLGECGIFYFGTVDGDAPVIRPLGFKMLVDGELYFGVGTFKEVYAQLTANPNVYICATKPDGKSWVRVSGKAVCDDDPALTDAAWVASPQLKPLYEDNGWTMGIFHLVEGKVTYVENLMAPVATEEF
ncbi:MAG: pyridoxamine 5'-phosphate oxidase family protein [Eggerthellaceae bacterium]|nr:pyridoxamine 5'-phosphate oxidase family protein [Eggerthellaceae bacterium]